MSNTFKLSLDLRQNPTAKVDIQKLATAEIKVQYQKSNDKQLFLESVIAGANWDLNFIDHPEQSKRAVGWLLEMVGEVQ
tara:strand:- start:1617 stop:1853 length:237 start_codon:yes stop_codon:yes gene_type:complete